MKKIAGAFATILVLGTAVGCGDDADPTDAGGGIDTGVAEIDSGTEETDSGTEETDSGTGGTDSGTTGGQCTNAADEAALELPHGTGANAGKTADEHAEDCARSCIGQAAGTARQTCINTCIQAADRVNGAITSTCTACFALAADCVVTNCVLACIADATAPGCITCQCDSGCIEMTDTCSGRPSGICP